MWDLDVGCKTFMSFISLQHWIRCCDVLRCQGGQTCVLFEVFCEGSQRSFAHLETGLRILEVALLGPFWQLKGMSINIKQLAKPVLIQHFNQSNVECAKISFISRNIRNCQSPFGDSYN